MADMGRDDERSATLEVTLRQVKSYAYKYGDPRLLALVRRALKEAL